MGMRPVASQFKETQFFRDNLTQYNLGAGHGAIDYATPIGTPVVANADGVVTFADWCWNLPGESWESRYYQIKAPFGNMRVGGGIMVTIDHGGGNTSYVTVSAHLSKTDLNAGQRVRKGQVIGYTGNTGSSTGPHLHFALLWKPFAWSNGYYGGIDPLPFVREAFKILVGGVQDPGKDITDVALQGIDVSAYQPADIVRRVASDFVIVKTTEAVGWKSDRWEAQLADARRLGKKVGVYHFARPLRNSSDAEAQFFYDTVKHRDSPDLVWFLDWEEEGAYQYTVWAHDFMKKLDRLTGKQTGLYANTQALKAGVWQAVDKARPLWRAFPVVTGTGYLVSANLPGAPAGWTKLVMDQYSFFGRLPGYAGDLDLNIYYGGIQQWKATGGAATPAKRDLLEEIMASPAERAEFAKEIVTALLTYKNEKVVGKNGPDLYGLIVKASEVGERRIPLTGNDPEGKPYEGTTSLNQEAAWGTFRGFRDRRIETGHQVTQELIAAVAAALGVNLNPPAEGTDTKEPTA